MTKEMGRTSRMKMNEALRVQLRRVDAQASPFLFVAAVADCGIVGKRCCQSTRLVVAWR